MMEGSTNDALQEHNRLSLSLFLLVQKRYYRVVGLLRDVKAVDPSHETRRRSRRRAAAGRIPAAYFEFSPKRELRRRRFLYVRLPAARAARITNTVPFYIALYFMFFTQTICILRFDLCRRSPAKPALSIPRARAGPRAAARARRSALDSEAWRNYNSIV
ncbi:hypothetical protein EVAR_38660_1 [Eumeta japonica]|uniref:Uncharacterized protein n=1 Tax=Eumeta variegata TaxID=151549 RepID=A0A4C1XZ43_EUMVA|nr:hypothetical protein EVAR_38660_1 [Eumeta japonica]